MNEHKISSPTDLDTALGANALRMHSSLWKVAEGHSFRWSEILVAVAFAEIVKRLENER
jgi:hypothetical protein